MLCSTIYIAHHLARFNYFNSHHANSSFTFGKCFNNQKLVLSPLKRGFKLIIDRLLLRLWLFVAGFFYYSFQLTPLRKVRGKSIRRNPTLIVSNHVSVFDFLLYSASYSPIITTTLANGTVRVASSVWDVVLNSSAYPASGSGVSLSSVIESSDGVPVVVFPEATCTNGRGVLNFTPVLTHLDPDTPVIFSHLKYDYPFYSPCFTVGSLFLHLYSCLCQPWQLVKIKYAYGTLREGGADCVASLGRSRVVGLGVEDKVKFLEYYEERESGYWKKKK